MTPSQKSDPLRDLACEVIAAGVPMASTFDATDAARIVVTRVLQMLEDGYHPQKPSTMHPADYIRKRLLLDGHEGLVLG